MYSSGGGHVDLAWPCGLNLGALGALITAARAAHTHRDTMILNTKIMSKIRTFESRLNVADLTKEIASNTTTSIGLSSSRCAAAGLTPAAVCKHNRGLWISSSHLKDLPKIVYKKWRQPAQEFVDALLTAAPVKSGPPILEYNELTVEAIAAAAGIEGLNRELFMWRIGAGALSESISLERLSKAPLAFQDLCSPKKWAAVIEAWQTPTPPPARYDKAAPAFIHLAGTNSKEFLRRYEIGHRAELELVEIIRSSGELVIPLYAATAAQKSTYAPAAWHNDRAIIMPDLFVSPSNVFVDCKVRGQPLNISGGRFFAFRSRLIDHYLELSSITGFSVLIAVRSGGRWLELEATEAHNAAVYQPAGRGGEDNYLVPAVKFSPLNWRLTHLTNETIPF